MNWDVALLLGSGMLPHRCVGQLPPDHLVYKKNGFYIMYEF